MIEQVLEGYENNDIPLDTIWMDIDYMEDFMSWTVDERRYNLEDFKTLLEKYKKKLVLIAEPAVGIKWGDKDEYYRKGKEMDIFIKNSQGKNLINKVWVGISHFIDYFNPKAKEVWNSGLDTLSTKINYSGIWLDMNEIATFENGQIDENSNPISCEDDTNYPYLPGNKILERNTICPNALHYNSMTHIQLHNYYPNQQSKLTHEYLSQKNKDEYPFILTRANAPGIGQYASHWTGDNLATFEFYKLSISEIMNSNLFGIPHTGADICGFGKDINEELCANWYQMGVMYPFARAHTQNDTHSKEPFAMSDLLTETAKLAIKFRYSILKYYYSLFMLSGKTGTIFRPLFFEFPEDKRCLHDFRSFLIGDSLHVVPNINERSTNYTTAYFPKGSWYDLRTNSKVQKLNEESADIEIKNELRQIPATFLRSGKTIFTNDIDGVKNTYDLNNKFNLLIALHNNDANMFYSTGYIPAINNYHSKQEVEGCIQRNCFVKVNTLLNSESKELNIKFKKAKFYGKEFVGFSIKRITIYGLVDSTVKTVINNEKRVNLTMNVNRISESAELIQFEQELEIKDDEINLILIIE
jgi:alpha-glucosidase/lysosomal alpha-glucosidase